ncbi:MAG: ubiquitin-like domain-containing protein [Acidimicrobiia bacterium]
MRAVTVPDPLLLGVPQGAMAEARLDESARERKRSGARPKSRDALRDGARRRALSHVVRPSPAREQAPEPEAWLPVLGLADLPTLEELLLPENLVDSGQTIAIRMRARDPQPFEEPPFVQRTRVAPAVAAAVSPGVAARRAARTQVRQRQLRRAGLIGLLVLALALVAAFFLPSDRTARLAVDGAERTVSYDGDTVAAVVRSANVWLGPYDRVVPALGARVPSSGVIRVVRARPMVVDVDGAVRTAWVAATDVAMLRDELKLDAALQATTNDALESAAMVVFRRPIDVALSADGEDRNVTVLARTVGELLAARGVALAEADYVTPAAPTVLTSGMRVSVTRVTGSERLEERAVPRGTVRRNDASMAAGTQKVIDPGADGRARVRILTVKRDGAVSEERVVQTEVITPARPQVIAVGTRSRGVTPRSGGQPAAAPPSYSRSETGGATWYDYIPGTCAHKTIPKGTVVRVTNLATGASTTCVVADRGPFMAGRVIDLTPDVFSRIAPLSAGVVNVRLDWA